MKDNNISKVELLERINQSFETLKETIERSVTSDLLSLGSTGWSIKDHYTHLAAWVQAAAELLKSGNGFTLMGIQDAFAQEWSEIDKINDLIYRSYMHLSTKEAKEFFYNSHCQMLEALESVSDEELQRLYPVCLPDRRQVSREIPIWQIIVWITYEHFDEHKLKIKTEPQ